MVFTKHIDIQVVAPSTVVELQHLATEIMDYIARSAYTRQRLDLGELRREFGLHHVEIVQEPETCLVALHGGSMLQCDSVTFDFKTGD